MKVHNKIKPGASPAIGKKSARGRLTFLLFLTLLMALLGLEWGCGATATKEKQTDLCNCDPTEPFSLDYRTAAKHVNLPSGTPTEITVDDVLNFVQGPPPAADAPRSGRELQLFHIANGFAQLVWLNPSDCDVHVELSATADKNAPRIIVETPHMDSYCSSRQQLAAQFNAHGVIIDNNRKELDPPLPAEVLGLAFQDIPHSTRGSAQVATVWELHPAVVTLK
jgi:hypothetical protein